MILPLSLTLILALLAAAHVWWALGRIWPAASEAGLARAVIGDGRVRMPPPWQPASPLVLIGSIVIGAIFFIRGSAGYSPRWRGKFTAEPFRTRDFYLYSPLCLAIGVAFIKLLTREMV